jgi:CHAT domain-containing protein
MLLVAAEHTQDKTLTSLPNVRAEVTAVTETTKTVMRSSAVHCMLTSAQTAEVARSLSSAHFVHIACHGIQHPTEPLHSAFCLSDGSLTVTQLMKLDLKKAFFAFLSACETAKGDKRQPDQTVHLAATMLFVGFQSIVATLW